MLTVCIAIALLAGCAKMQGLLQSGKGDATLSAGLKQYDEGRYVEAAKNLRAAIDQGLSNKDMVNAHKHLAFIHCASNRERQCRDEFRQALAIDPALQLTPAEADHPVWGPVFKSVKAGR